MSSHDQLHHHHEAPPVNPEMTRRQALARGLGFTFSILATGAVASACGETRSEQGLILPNSEVLPPVTSLSIDEPVPVDGLAQASRIGNQTQTKAPESPMYVVNAGDYVISGDPNLLITSFSFDDVPSRRVMQQIMTIFEQKGLPGGTGFFGVGMFFDIFPEAIQDAVNRGFKIYNHSYSHNYGIQENIDELDTMQAMLKNVQGEDNGIYRKPGGGVNQQLLQALRERGMFYLWSTSDLKDYTTPREPEEVLLRNYRNQLHPGMHALLHGFDTHGNTALALPSMIDEARVRGYEIVSPEEHMKIGNPQKRFDSFTKTQSDLNEDIIAKGNFENNDAAEQEWIATLQAVLEDGVNITTEKKDIINREIAERTANIQNK